jgi:DNA modification methylase
MELSEIKQAIGLKPYFETSLGVLYNADCLEVMKLMPDKCVDLVLTSPPYDNLRDYEGIKFDFGKLAFEIYKVCGPGSVCVWVVGDQTVNGSETGTSFRQALFFKELGFNIHDTMIYQKDGMTFPETNRYYPSFEYMFILSKSTPKTTNLIRDKKNIWENTKIKGNQREVNGELKKRSRHGEKIPAFSIRRNVWLYGTGYLKSTKYLPAFQHPAIFPEKLAQDHIVSWSNKNDIVLDPFLGSGTTAVVCEKLGRRWIGIEISKKYCEIAAKRINVEASQIKMVF